MKELTLEQVQDVNGGFDPVTAVAVTFAVGFLIGFVQELMN
jgi:lactobin A/cerein 7B family class IIb bacteriocin